MSPSSTGTSFRSSAPRRSRRSRLTTSRRSTTSSPPPTRRTRFAASWTCCAASSPSPSSAGYIATNPASTDSVNPRPQAAASARHRAAHPRTGRTTRPSPTRTLAPPGPARRLHRAPRRGALGTQRQRAMTPIRGELAITHALKEVTTQAATDTPDTQRLDGLPHHRANQDVREPQGQRAGVPASGPSPRTSSNSLLRNPGALLFTTPSRSTRQTQPLVQAHLHCRRESDPPSNHHSASTTSGTHAPPGSSRPERIRSRSSSVSATRASARRWTPTATCSLARSRS